MTENSIVTIQDEKSQQQLTNGLIMADRFVNKNYLINASEQEVVPFDLSKINCNGIRLYKISKLVCDKEENVNDKLISVYSALQDVDSSALMILDSNGKDVALYIGVYSDNNAAIAGDILEKSFKGNFSGSEISKGLSNSEINDRLDTMIGVNSSISKKVSSVTIIPSSRDEDKDKFVQGIEKLIDTMQGESYTVFFIARHIEKSEIETIKRGYEDIFTALSPFSKTTLSYGENSSKAVSNGLFKNFSASVNNSVSKTIGENSGSSNSYTYGRNSGNTFSFLGTGYNTGHSNSNTNSSNYGITKSNTSTEGHTDTTSEGENHGETETFGDSKTLTVENQNKYVADLMEKIDDNLKRIKECEAFGLWECSTYFVAESIQTSVVAANAYKALMSGDNTSAQNSFLNVWGIVEPEKAQEILKYIRYGQHPIIKVLPEAGFETQLVTPGNYVSGRELPLFMGVPHKSVTGLVVSNIAEFGRNVFQQNSKDNSKVINIGKIYHMGRVENTNVDLNLQSLTSHTFITGSTGCGKSNTTYCILEKLIENEIPFMVIEPAKGEYKDAFSAAPNINVYSTNPTIAQMLKINPFKFNSGIHILEHLDKLIDVFNTCWEMYAAMPAILKDAVEKIYIEKGWDLLNSVYINGDEPQYPTFDDLLRMLPNVIDNSQYSTESKGDYTGALVTRVASLANGITGQIFCDNYDISDELLFDSNTIIDLSRVGSSETKSLIMGILVLKLSEYRMATADGANKALKHITVMEEAHNLLKRVKPDANGSSVVGKSVEMICNSIAEMRTYGEGFIIVDQSPTSVDIAAVKNTNTKIIMRLPEKDDCVEMGNALSLNDDQIKEISKLGTGVAVIMQNNWLEAVLTRINRASERYAQKINFEEYNQIVECRGLIIKELLDQYVVKKQLNKESLLTIIGSMPLSKYKKREYYQCVITMLDRLSKGRDNSFFSDTLLNISGTRALFNILKPILKANENDTDKEFYTEDSLKKWKIQFDINLNKYVSLPYEYITKLQMYLVYAMEIKDSSINYFDIYERVF